MRVCEPHYTKRQIPHKPCAACLYRVGLGIKRISRLLPHPPRVIKNWVTKAGVYEPLNRIGLGNKVRHRLAQQVRAERLRKREEERIQKAANRPPKQTIEEKAAKARLGAASRYKENAEAKKAYAKRYYESVVLKDPVKLQAKKAAMEKWKSSNPERVKSLRAKWCKIPENRISLSLRNRVRDFIQTGSGMETAKRLVGCSLEALRRHLESQFRKGMSWENYGDWHIDHILPCASFNLTDPAEQRRCFHYTNLQPLWAKENLSKGARIVQHQPSLLLSI
jgi:hypothetical protein